MFAKILVANRGEIACRIIRTARAMGLATVAVYSEADRNAPHVEAADEAEPIGPAAARESYLNAEALVAACKRSGAEAVHPGYGFLAENADFARRLLDQGIVFIGPRPEAIAAMGDKIASKRLARAAGVHVIPGHDEPIDSAGQAVAIARDLGYPVMIKATAGGGGKGLRVARDDAEVAEGFEACKAEAAAAFGDDRVFLEKFIDRPRHIEIQVLGDAHGNVVSLGERECSLQRRHQKVVEEAPSPFLDDAARRAMSAQAVALARAVDYTSAGTVEFVVGAGGDFYFLEMNTRLQVEHPVTEMTTGLDLVEWMIRIAAGEKLGITQEQVRRDGWAIECRINAEDPTRNFLPSTGRLVRYQPPEPEPGAVRIDTGVVEGGEVSIHYDSMIAKLVAHGATRAEAAARMREALDAFVIRGVSSNLAFQSALMRNPRFVAGDLDVGLIGEQYPEGYQPPATARDDHLLLPALAAYVHRRHAERDRAVSGRIEIDSRAIEPGWIVLAGAVQHAMEVRLVEGGAEIESDGATHRLRTDWKLGEIVLRGVWDDRAIVGQVERLGLGYRILHGGARLDAVVATPREAELLALMPHRAAPDLSRVLLAPMPGLLVEFRVGAGQTVHAGEALAVVEAMKMRNVLKADRDGVVAELLAEPGTGVAVDQPILRFD